MRFVRMLPRSPRVSVRPHLPGERRCTRPARLRALPRALARGPAGNWTCRWATWWQGHPNDVKLTGTADSEDKLAAALSLMARV